MANRADRRAMERAAARTKAAGSVEAAAELDELRRVRAGTYALMQVLVSRAGATEDAPIHVPRGDWMTLPPTEKLKVRVDPATNDVDLYIERTV